MKADYHHALQLLQQGNPEQARGLYLSLLQRCDHLPTILNDIGVSHFIQKNPAQALQWYDAALLLDPAWCVALQNRGNALKELGRTVEAAACWYAAMEQSPDKAWCCNVGHQLLNLLLAEERNQEVEAYWQYLHRRYPDDLGILHNLANHIQNTAHRYSEAIAIYRTLEQHPTVEQHTLYNDWAVALKGQGLLAEAREKQLQALALQPFQPLIYSNYLFDLLYEPDLDPAWILEQHCRYEATQAFSDTVPYSHAPDGKDDPHRPLRIGYLSADFRYHSIGLFMLEPFRHHNRDQFEIYAYYNCPVQDDYTAQFRQHATVWRDIDGIHPTQAAKLIYDDKIDILVDLNGHTRGNLLPALLYKPASIQISWLGNVHSLGLSTVDYFITDAVADPPGLTEGQFVEQLLRLPDSFLCFSPYHDPPEILDTPAVNNGFVTFGLVGNFAKINPYMVGLYAQIMQGVPGSRCLIKSSAMDDPPSRDKLAALFAEARIGSERLIMRQRTDEPEAYLQGFREIDILLDFYPFNGETITCAALQMGVPVVTLAGTSHRSRAGLSIVTALGHPEWGAETADGFVAAALKLAKDTDLLNTLHHAVRDAFLASSLCDGTGFTRNLEAAYRYVWEQWNNAQVGKS